MFLFFLLAILFAFLGKTAEHELLSVTSSLAGSSNIAMYTMNETITITMTVDLSRETSIYFKDRYFLTIYDNKGFQIYAMIFSTLNRGYWTGRHTIATSSLSFNAGTYTIILYSLYPEEFRVNCSNYNNLMRQLSYSIIRDQKSIKLQYYGR